MNTQPCYSALLRSKSRICAMTNVSFLKSTLSLVCSMGTAYAQPTSAEVQFDCSFFEAGVSSNDKNAKEWYDSDLLKRMTFVATLEPAAVTEAPGRAEFWGKARVDVTSQKINFSWRVKAKPLDRTPEVWLIFDRFSGQTVQGYSLLVAANKGPLEVHWTRTGSCAVNQRKI